MFFPVEPLPDFSGDIHAGGLAQGHLAIDGHSAADAHKPDRLTEMPAIHFQHQTLADKGHPLVDQHII